MDRRKFLMNGIYGASVLLVGSSCSRKVKKSFQSGLLVQSLSFRITSAVKEMVTHNEINDARCFFWIYKEENFPADCPGPIIVTTEGETLNIKVTNDLDEPHAFFIKDAVDSGPIAPGETRHLRFKAPRPGSYLYHDNLNAPVNRVMGLHGALIVMPRNLKKNSTPYSNPTKEVITLFEDLGGQDNRFPGLAWGEGDPKTNTPAFRQHVWLLHEASPVLFAEVGRFTPGKDYPADKFVDLFTNDPYADTFHSGRFNRKPHFFTIDGQSGLFSHHNPFINPFRRVGEPVLIRVLNAGLFTHSMHYHSNHYFVTAVNNKVSDNILLVDTFDVRDNEGFDFIFSFVRPPDVPNEGGRGRSVDKPLIGKNGRPVWPPVEEMKVFVRPVGGKNDDLVRLSPLCYPMHDHCEPTQTAQGANYPLGMISGCFFTGDRNTPGFMNFPDYHFEFDIAETNVTRPIAPLIPIGHLHHHDGNGNVQFPDGAQEQQNQNGQGETTTGDGDNSGPGGGNSGRGGGNGGHGVGHDEVHHVVVNTVS